jgi:hypothetical protein
MQNEQPYMMPELKLVGDTSEVVLGSTGIGFDVMGQRLPGGKEFETDEDLPAL